MQSSARCRCVEYFDSSFWYCGIFLIIWDKSLIDALSDAGTRFDSTNFFRFLVTFLCEAVFFCSCCVFYIFFCNALWNYLLLSAWKLTWKRRQCAGDAVPSTSHHSHQVAPPSRALQRILQTYEKKHCNDTVTFHTIRWPKRKPTCTHRFQWEANRKPWPAESAHGARATRNQNHGQ